MFPNFFREHISFFIMSLFILNSVLLGIGLAMDAFSVSVANGLNEQKMSHFKMSYIAGTYAFFQFIMPLIGWICVRTVVEFFCSFQRIIPYIALILLFYIGGKMIIENLKYKKEDDKKNIHALAFSTLIIQGIATSIDALSVGFTIAEYNLELVFFACSIIAIVTFLLSFIGIIVGKKVGEKFTNKAEIFGGIILIGIGIEIFLTS